MVYGLPVRDEPNWDTKLNASVDAVKTTADTATTGLAAHKADVANPHAVTKAQVGLGNVDNTSDVNKPISTATQTALNNRVLKWTPSTAYTIGDPVLAPDGSLVKAKATFTSGASYSSANWTSSVTYAGTQAQTELGSTYSALAATKNVFTGKVELNGGFTNGYDTMLWIAGANRANPTNNSQGMYIQHRLSGDLGGLVHDAGASELRVSGGSNNGAGSNAWETSLVITGGANTLGNMNGITSNFHAENNPTGTVSTVSLYRAQTIPALAGGITVATVYGAYIEPQTVGTTENWSVYAPSGTSLFGTLQLDAAAPSTARALQFSTNKSLRWLIRTTSTAESGANAGTDFEILARTDAGAANFTPFTITRSTGLTSINNGLKVTGNLGFYGTTPIAKPTVAAAATDATTTQTLANSLRTQLIALGLMA